jgi:hypothetical protein
MLAMASWKQHCTKGKIRQRIDGALQGLAPDGRVSAADAICCEHGAQVATILVQRVPAFKHLELDAIAGFVLLLVAAGMDTFCEWAKGDGGSARWEGEE